MTKRIGRVPVEVNISAPQNNHIPIFDESTRLWTTIESGSLFSELLSGSNNFSGSQTIEGDLTVSGSIYAFNISASSITGSLLGTASAALNSISASYLSGSEGIVQTFTSSGDIRVRTLTISTGFTSGVDNISIGSGSLLGTSSLPVLGGDNNIAIGNRILTRTILGSGNTAVGHAALENFTGSYSTAIGSYSLWKSPSGRNSAFGQASLPYLVSGSGNTGLGDATMFSLLTGSNNTAVGNVGMQRMLLGNSNTSLGSGAFYLDFLSGSNNTVIGFSSGLGVVSGSNNTIIGANVAGLPSTLNNNIILADGQGNIKARYSSSIWTLSDSVVGNFTGSLLGTASWAQNSLTASYAPAYLPLTGGTINGDVVVNGTASISFLNVIYESASVIYSSGSNQFGDAPDDIQTLYGFVVIPTGSLSITGSISSTGGLTGSLYGTSSWALTASYATNVPETASYAIQAISSSYPIAVSGSTIYTPFNVSGFSTDNSIFLGYSAGNLATNSYSSNFIGSFAGTNATSAYRSNFIGAEAGFDATNANLSNFIGSNAGNRATNAAYSNFLGISVGIDATNAIFSNFIGAGTGVNAASASYSTLIGYSVGSNFGNSDQSIKSNNVIIGTNITLANGRQDSINLGGLIFGTGSYSTITGNPFSGSANGKIGINQPFPLFSLDVSGSGRYTNGLQVTGSLISPSITGSLFGTASWASNAVTASYINPSNLQGISLFRINTGSISASLSTNANSLFLINSASSTYFNISSSGNTELYSDLFIVKNFTTNQPVFTVSQSVVKFATQSLDPVGTAEAGTLWFTSTNMYVALD